MSQLIFRLPTHSVTRTLQKGDQRAKPGSHPGRRPYRHKRDEINTWDGGRGVGSTLTTRAATCWRSSPVHTAAVVRQHYNLIRCSRNHWIPKITRIDCLISKRRVVEAGSLVGSDRNRTSTLMREGRGPTNRKE